MFKYLYVIVLSLAFLVASNNPASVPLKITEPVHIDRFLKPTVDRSTPPARHKPRMKLTDLPKAWQRLVYCESTNRQHAVSPSGLHHGYFQIHEGFFKAKNIDWVNATLEEQWLVAQYVYDRQGARAWTCAKQANLK
jgi:hypothetical protein